MRKSLLLIVRASDSPHSLAGCAPKPAVEVTDASRSPRSRPER